MKIGRLQIFVGFCWNISPRWACRWFPGWGGRLFRVYLGPFTLSVYRVRR